MWFSVRGIVQTGYDALDYAVSDLAVLQNGSTVTVFATSGPNGGLVGYALPENGVVSVVDTAFYNPLWATGISDDIALLDDGYGGGRVVFGAVGVTQLGSYSVSLSGTIGPVEALDGLAPDLVPPRAFGTTVDGQILVAGSTPGFSAYDPSGLSLSQAYSVGDKLRVLAASQSAGALTDLDVDLSQQGLQVVAAHWGQIFGGGDKDDILVGQEGADRISGGGGADILVDGAGCDTLSGGAGSDLFVLRDDGEEDIITDFDVDQDRLDLSSWPMLYDPSSLEITATSDGAIVTWRNETLILYSAGGGPILPSDLRAAVLQGINRPMDLSGLDLPDDQTYDLTGTDGDDVLRGGPEGETIAPGLGNDIVWAGAGDDIIVGGSGQNTIYLEDGNDIYSDEGASSAEDGDIVYGGAGRDFITTGAGHDTITGDGGNDQIYAGGGDDQADGGEGDDVIAGAEGDDLLYGGDGADTLTGDDGNDRLYGQTGNDRMSGGSGADKLNGGDGSDVLFGDSQNDLLLGAWGDDYLYGGSGNDRLYGQSGNDRISGGSGADKLNGGNGNDALFGGSQNDLVVGAWGNDRLYGGSGNDRLYGQTGNDRMSGGSGADKLNGGDGSDVLFGDSQNDLLLGAGARDYLYGGSGNDRLYGHSGNDRIFGNSGNDRLYGGSGADTFVFHRRDGHDRIMDFNPGHDAVQLDGIRRGAVRLHHVKGGRCQWQFKFPQYGQGKIPHFRFRVSAGFSDWRLRFLGAVRAVSAVGAARWGHWRGRVPG